MADVKEQFTETIRQLVPIFSLARRYQDEVIKRSEIIDLPRGRYLFRQGDRDDFSYYLLAGELEMQAGGQIHSSLHGGSDSARYPIAQLQPRQFSARAAGRATVLQVNRHALDKLLVVEQEQNDTRSGSHVEVSELDKGAEEIDWMTRILQSELFSRLPTANIHQLFAVLEPVEFSHGDRVVEQGGPGDYYYIVQEGRCEVLCRSTDGGEPIRLAELGPGDGFGEEALLADARRNASVRMLSDGILVRLTKQHFIELIKKPALSWLDYADACQHIAAGALWLDVRLPEEYAQSHIGDSLNLPLDSLRSDTSRLQRDQHYIAYCDSGGRSSVAAFLLTQQGYTVSYLDGGLMNCPPDDLTSGAVASDADAGEVVNADVRASAYAAEAAVANYEVEQATEDDGAERDAVKRAEYEAMVEKLRAEHARLEAAKQQAAEEAREHREAEESRIEKLRAETEQQLKQQKEKLEAVYAQNAKEMERLRTLKQQAEAQIKTAQEKADSDSAKAQRRMQEADTIKQQLSEAKAAIEREAEQQRQQQASMEKQVQDEAMRKIEAERRNLAEQYQRSNEALEQAQREKAAAEAARQAANDEAQQIIAEFKEAHAKARAEEEAKLKAERERLEKQSRELREAMTAADKAKQDAEAARQAAEAQLAKLKIKMAQDSERKDRDLQQRVQAAEAEAQQAQAEFAEAEKAQKKVQAAHDSNVRGLARQSAEEQKLREQIENEVSEWLTENELEAPSQEELNKQAEHIRRIKERSEAAKRESQNAARSLLDEIAGQLGDKK